MEVITIESQAFKVLSEKISTIARFVSACHTMAEEEPDDGWVDSHEVCRYLKISGRTLQHLRSSRSVNFSLIRGKTFYRISEIKRLLNDSIIRRSDEHLQKLIKNRRLNADKGRNTKANR